MSRLMENYDLLTPYGKEVLVRIKQLETPIKFDGSLKDAPSLPASFLNQLILVKRTGSHTWQPIICDYNRQFKVNGYPHIYGLHVSSVHELSEFPELFI